ncbi:GNAT family acetyltransferase [Halomonas sp. HP20-15]|uniref:GNAT family acetyltransferase n=1 Tax=Halomonas sp. HP20-15 TaxID=3085901 RepID=UPI002980FC4A|nr:GNAT family acetyltransferase [Halomonas sp. HP20-15]MDW5377850.1 GNAT family acetyltransferase [Halomonas sp. HP20-15]
MQIRPFQHADEDAVIALWQACELSRPWNDPRRDIARKLAEDPSLFLVGILDGELIASAMAGYEGHRGWLHYLAVAPAHQGRGHGKRMIAAVERALIARGCPKLMLMVRHERPELLELYDRLGYTQGEFVTLGKRLIADD